MSPLAIKSRVPRVRKRAIGSVLSFLCCAVVGAAAIAACQSEAKPPTDSKVLALFKGRRAAFARLIDLMSEDAGRVSYLSADGLRSIPSDRRAAYNEALRQIGDKIIVNRDYDGTTRFIVAGNSKSAIGPGWLKGVEYIPADPEKKGVLVDSLDAAEGKSADVYLKSIEPRWYLVFQRDAD